MKMKAKVSLIFVNALYLSIEASDSIQLGTTWANQAWCASGGNCHDDTTGRKLVNVDLFDTSEETIKSLVRRGHQVSCYLSAGSMESWRDDADSFTQDMLGLPMDGWVAEVWLDIANTAVRPVIAERLNLASSKGCTAIEADNVDCWENDCVENQNSDDYYKHQLSYNKWLSESAHSRGLLIGLKNNLMQIKDLVGYYDFAINEQCIQFGECDYYQPFRKENKAVFGTEYTNSLSDICSVSNPGDMDTKMAKGDTWQDCVAPSSQGVESVKLENQDNTTSDNSTSSEEIEKVPEEKEMKGQVVSVPNSITWANLAWGPGGSTPDTVDGKFFVNIDLFDTDESVIQKYKDEGHLVCCYFSAGTQEVWREDSDKFTSEMLGIPMADWYGETWLDIRVESIRDIMADRMDLAKEKGCHAVEPDNVDCWQNDCVPNQVESEMAAAQLEYNIWTAKYAHSIGLAVGLKNNLGQAAELQYYYEFAINEECYAWDECDVYDNTFLSANKAIFGTEYNHDESKCEIAKNKNKIALKLSKAEHWDDCFQIQSSYPELTYYTPSDEAPPDTKIQEPPTEQPEESKTSIWTIVIGIFIALCGVLIVGFVAFKGYVYYRKRSRRHKKFQDDVSVAENSVYSDSADPNMFTSTITYDDA